jgi:xylan 1,4-beta-xylosidase
MGKPVYPTSQQIAKLRQAAELPAPELKSVARGQITLTLPPQGLALVELQ